MTSEERGGMTAVALMVLAGFLFVLSAIGFAALVVVL